MPNRTGVSLVEVLVAALLLAVGIAGTMHALVAAARLREQAIAREQVAGAVRARVAWFGRVACAGSDTLVRAHDTRVEESWRISRTGATARLDGRARIVAAGGGPRLALVHERRCP